MSFLLDNLNVNTFKDGCLLESALSLPLTLGLGVVGIFEKRLPTTEAQYFFKVEDMN